jgi:hypothetical protein
MNPAKAINIVAQTEDIETTTIRPLDILLRPAQGVMRGTRLRYGLLLGSVLLSAWLAITVLNSIKELNAEFDRIHAVVTLPVR